MSFEDIQNKRDELEKEVKNKFSLLINQVEENLDIFNQIGICFNNMIVRRYKETKEKSSNAEGLIHMISIKNFSFLQAVYYLVKINLNKPAQSLIRTIFEGLHYMYILRLDNELGEKIVNFEFYNKGKRVTYKEIKEKLYKDKHLLSINFIYDGLSKATHPSIKGQAVDNKFREGTTEDILKNIISYSFFNSIIIAELYWDNFNEEEKEKILSLLNSFDNETKSRTITPNKFKLESIREKLNYQK